MKWWWWTESCRVWWESRSCHQLQLDVTTEESACSTANVFLCLGYLGTGQLNDIQISAGLLKDFGYTSLWPNICFYPDSRQQIYHSGILLPTPKAKWATVTRPVSGCGKNASFYSEIRTVNPKNQQVVSHDFAGAKMYWCFDKGLPNRKQFQVTGSHPSCERESLILQYLLSSFHA